MSLQLEHISMSVGWAGVRPAVREDGREKQGHPEGGGVAWAPEFSN